MSSNETPKKLAVSTRVDHSERGVRGVGSTLQLKRRLVSCGDTLQAGHIFCMSGLVLDRMVDFKVQQRRFRTCEKTIVSTIYGPIKGVKRRSIYGDAFYSFERIPFARPPVEKLRYKAPQPPEPWTEVRSCTSPGPKPLQKHFVFQMTEGSEDCLYLNVYTKNLNPQKLVPVMVWIYGGGFQFGEASRALYSPDYLLREDVVVISINYRLGPFGFLCIQDPSFDVPGNAGLKDQVMALRWVKANCERFGGDSNNITIFGDSAGGASVHFMMITEQTRGLFHKAISMSGNALSPWAVTPQHNWPYRLAVAAGYTGEDNDEDVFAFLHTAKASDIVKANENLCSDAEKRERIGFSFGPVIEPYVTDHCVVPKRPVEMMRTAWSNQIPMIIGGVSNEGLLLYSETKTNPKILNELDDCRFVVPLELGMDREGELCKEYGLQLRKVYFGDKQPCLDTLHEYLLMVSHEYFWFPIYRTVLSRLSYATAPTYLYRFDFDSKDFNHLRILSCGKKMRGTCHGDDLSYLFYNSVARKLKNHSREWKCIERLVSMWTHFAAESNPNYDPEHVDLWQPVTNAEALKCLNISDDLKVIDVPEMNKLLVWQGFFRSDVRGTTFDVLNLRRNEDMRSTLQLVELQIFASTVARSCCKNKMSSLSFMDILKLTYRVLEFKYEQNKHTTNIYEVVTTTKGDVKGVKRLTIWGDDYFSFEGIPYAKPPLGKLRFRAPQPAEPWDGVWDGTKPAEQPLQTYMLFRKYKGSEDCLYLNVFTKSIHPETPRPVMVWIYGGGFQIGEATRDMYSPDFLISKDIVLVTIQYRLGPFGFLSLEDPTVQIPGNAGIKDQILALRWVKENIAAFGGDPNNVTLFGESAGGTSVHFCLLSEQSKGLVHKGIIMSGSALCPWGNQQKKRWAYRLAKVSGYEGEDQDTEVYEFLLNTKGPDLVRANGILLTKEEKHKRLQFAFVPIIEPYWTEDCVLNEPPYELMKKSWSNSIPLIFSGTSFEGLLFYPEIKRRPATLDEVRDCKNLLPPEIQDDSEKCEACALKLKKIYFGVEECSQKTLMQFLDLHSYREFWSPIYRTLLSRQRHSTAPTYLYRFDYDSRDGNAIRNILCGRDVRGTCHGDDLCYIFFAMFSHRPAKYSKEYEVTRTLIDIVTSFAKNSDPNCDMLDDVIFEPIERDEGKLKCLNISENIEFIELPGLDKLKTWCDFYAPGKL
ncbi:uncharacterized protein [Eurosta solidaginis]|uniref:uncharacterized protein n=1 Tax=Eurosta solidaginis TaxID=178769 RepID=UPI00353171D2